MHKIIDNFKNIQNQINSKISELKINNYIPNIVAVSKTFNITHINPLIDYGHEHFGENKVQEALNKWSDIKIKNHKIKLHMVGKLQTNKVKHAIKIFDFIHSVDNLKLAQKISEEQKKIEKKPKIFLQVNFENESQKSGIASTSIFDFYTECVKLNLDIIGTMCLPPISKNPEIYFSKLKQINQRLNLLELSMGMSNDYLKAIEYSSTYLRIGSQIFGERS
mgnify:CR=1 FL=1